jgi:hypothetical protein
MSGDHVKKEIMTGGDKSTSHGKAPVGGLRLPKVLKNMI